MYLQGPQDQKDPSQIISDTKLLCDGLQIGPDLGLEGYPFEHSLFSRLEFLLSMDVDPLLSLGLGGGLNALDDIVHGGLELHKGAKPINPQGPEEVSYIGGEGLAIGGLGGDGMGVAAPRPNPTA